MRACARLVRPVVLCASVLVVAATPRPALAHHGKGFLIVESDELPHARQVFLFTDFGLAHHEEEDEIELSPGLLFGLSDRVAFELHTHFAKHEGESLGYEAVAPALKLGLTPPESEEPLKLSFSAEYEFGSDDHPNVFEGRVIAAYRTHDVNLTFNLIGEKSNEEESELEWGYDAGLRPWPERELGVGLEARGALSGPSAHELLAGVYFTGDRFTLKLGAGKGFGEGPDWTFRAGVVLQF